LTDCLNLTTLLFHKETNVSSTSNSESDSDVAKISALRKRWEAAVKASDFNGIAGIVTDDVVAVDVDGRCLRGKEELKADFLKRWGLFDSELKLSSIELLVRDKWAIETGEVDRTLTAVRSGVQIRSRIRSIAVFARQPDASWRIARILVLPD